MLEKVPSTPNTPNADGAGRSGGVPIQVAAVRNQNNEKKDGACC
jgi:hypothetical protein